MISNKMLMYIVAMVWITVLFLALIRQIGVLANNESSSAISVPGGTMSVAQRNYVVAVGGSVWIIDRSTDTVEIITRKGNTLSARTLSY